MELLYFSYSKRLASMNGPKESRWQVQTPIRLAPVWMRHFASRVGHGRTSTLQIQSSAFLARSRSLVLPSPEIKLLPPQRAAIAWNGYAEISRHTPTNGLSFLVLTPIELFASWALGMTRGFISSGTPPEAFRMKVLPKLWANPAVERTRVQSGTVRSRRR